MTKLKISADLTLPVDVVTQAVGVLAKRRAGKSYLARRLAEQLLRAGQQVVIVDPKGDWWGIRSSADGKSAGFSVVVFGGERGDVPLEPGSGALVAKLIVEEGVNALLDLSLFRKHEVATFMTAFLEDLYRLKAREQYRTAMMLIIDEADAIAPQKPQPNEARMLGAADDIVRRGGQRGIGCTLVTQRSAVLNKDVLTQVQILITLRTIAPQDLTAIKAWIDVHGTIEQQKTLLASLPSLPVGDAWFWSPGWPTDAGIFQRSHVSPIETFDSGATPTPGKRRSEPKKLADVDMDAIRKHMNEIMERAKADDPKALKARVAELERLLKAKGPEASEPERVEVPMFDQEAFEELKRQVSDDLRLALSNAKGALHTYMSKCLASGTKVPRVAPLVLSATKRDFQIPTPAATNGASSGGINKCARMLLTALVQQGRPLTLVQAAIIAGYSSNSGGVRNAAGELRAAGFAEGSNAALQATSSGVDALGSYDRLPTGYALAEYWYGQLGKAEREILRVVVEAYPKAVPLANAARKCGYSETSGGVRNAAGKLRTLELVQGGNDGMIADERLVG